MKLSDDLLQITTRLMLAKERRETLNVAQELTAFVEKVDKLESAKDYQKEKSISATLKFNRQEISKMSKTFKKEFIANGLAAHIIKRPSGKRGVYYEIRYRRNGYDLYGAATDLAEAKKRFLQQTEPGEIEKHRTDKMNPSGKNLFREVAEEWFSYKKTKLNPRTYSNYYSYYQRFLLPVFGDRPISTIKTIEVDKVMSETKGRIYEDLRIVVNSIFKYALLTSLISNNPVALVPFKKAERKSRRNLTKEEVLFLLHILESKEYEEFRQPILAMLYFGLRPCELETARIEGDFLIARNAKRKNGKIEYKKIPISDRIREKLDFSKSFAPPGNIEVLNRVFKKIFHGKNVTQYSLRHTFATKCQEYVRPDIVDIWMGDSPERLVGRVYTHFSDDFMREQMNKVLFDI